MGHSGCHTWLIVNPVLLLGGTMSEVKVESKARTAKVFIVTTQTSERETFYTQDKLSPM